MTTKICTTCDGAGQHNHSGEWVTCATCWGDPALLCQNCGNGPNEPCDCDAIAAAHENSDARAYERAHLPEVA